MKRFERFTRNILLSVIAILCLSIVLSGSQTVLFGPDPFSGTATNPLHTYNANWINSTLSNQWNDLLISTPNGGVVYNAGQSGSYITGQTWTDDQFGEAILAIVPLAASAKVCVQLHGSGGNNPDGGYCVGPDPNISGLAYRLFDVVDGLLASSATSAQANDVINIEVIAGVIKVRIGGVNGTLLSDLTTTDVTPYTGGSPGMYMNDATAKFTAFSAGSASTGGGGGGAISHGLLSGVN